MFQHNTIKKPASLYFYDSYVVEIVTFYKSHTGYKSWI